MKRKKAIKHRIEQKTADRKHTRRRARTKSTTKYNTGQPISPALPGTGIPSGRLGEFVKALKQRRR